MNSTRLVTRLLDIFVMAGATANAGLIVALSNVQSRVILRRSRVDSARTFLTATIALALTANFGSVFATYPHTLSYFNEIPGGPLNGADHLLDANIEWAQDLLFLKAWHDTHSNARPLYFAGFSLLRPGLFQIDAETVPLLLTGDDLTPTLHALEPTRPGWYAIGRKEHALAHTATRGNHGWSTPIPLSARIGYCITVHHLIGSPSPGSSLLLRCDQ